MIKAIDDHDVPLIFVAKFREYGIQVRDGGASFQVLNFCPWCGTTLPPSLRDQWFDEMERIGADPLRPESIPEAYTDERWYSERKS
jgi:hypothetical protein